MVGLGTPLGTDTYAAEHGRKRLREEQRLLGRLAKLNLKSAWLLLLSTAPHRQGGACLTSAERTSLGAYWAGWADALPVLRHKLPETAQLLLGTLEGDAPALCAPQETKGAARTPRR